MTALGLLFGVAYLVSLRWGSAGVLAVMAVAMPFFDSAAVSVGSFAVSPFYVGSILLVLLRLPRAVRGSVRGTDWLFVALLAVGLLTTLLGPSLFPRTRVLSSALDLDQQVDNLSVVGYSLSGFAQCAYLALNVALVLIAKRRMLDPRALDAGMTVGTVVAFSSWIATAVGLPWPVDLFSNSTRNFYAELPDRARAQFAEPSHLGVWALVALSYFVVRLLRAPTPRRAAAAGVLAAMSALSFASAGSGTAIVGVVIALAVLAVIAAVHVDWHAVLRGRIRRRWVALAAAVVIGAAASTPIVAAAVQEVVSDKRGTQSDVTRTFANAQGLRVLVDTDGLGIGLGANRASSMIALVLSTVGVVGLALFAAILVVAVRRGLIAGRADVVVPLVAFGAAAVVGFADFSSSVLWFLIATAYSAKAISQPDSSAHSAVISFDGVTAAESDPPANAGRRNNAFRPRMEFRTRFPAPSYPAARALPTQSREKHQ